MRFRVKRGETWFIVIDEQGQPVQAARILRQRAAPDDPNKLRFDIEVAGATYFDVPLAAD